jgi:hypothetical protein
MSTRENGKVTATAAVQLAPGANAVAVAKAVRERMADLEKAMPPGMKWSIPFDTAPFVTISIEKVLHTLLEAMVLVFAVMYLFLQKVRYTLIPAIVAPIALLGTLAVMLLAGFSINVLTMFGMVLAIGIIVDDAIVVVENVERIMHQEHLSPGGHTQGNARDHRRRDRHYRRAHRGIPAHGVFQRFGRCDLSPVHADDGRIDPVLRLPRPVADSSADLLLCSSRLPEKSARTASSPGSTIGSSG